MAGLNDCGGVDNLNEVYELLCEVDKQKFMDWRNEVYGNNPYPLCKECALKLANFIIERTDPKLLAEAEIEVRDESETN